MATPRMAVPLSGVSSCPFPLGKKLIPLRSPKRKEVAQRKRGFTVSQRVRALPGFCGEDRDISCRWRITTNCCFSLSLLPNLFSVAQPTCPSRHLGPVQISPPLPWPRSSPLPLSPGPSSASHYIQKQQQSLGSRMITDGPRGDLMSHPQAAELPGTTADPELLLKDPRIWTTFPPYQILGFFSII